MVFDFVNIKICNIFKFFLIVFINFLLLIWILVYLILIMIINEIFGVMGVKYSCRSL